MRRSRYAFTSRASYQIAFFLFSLKKNIYIYYYYYFYPGKCLLAPIFGVSSPLPFVVCAAFSFLLFLLFLFLVFSLPSVLSRTTTTRTRTTRGLLGALGGLSECRLAATRSRVETMAAFTQPRRSPIGSSSRGNTFLATLRGDLPFLIVILISTPSGPPHPPTRGRGGVR